MNITFVSLIVVLFLKTTNQQCLSENDNKPTNSNARAGLYTGQQRFSLALLEAISQLMPNDNLFFSPYSCYRALLIAYFLAEGQTENYLKTILRLDATQTKPDLFHAYLLDKLMTRLGQTNSSYEFSNANKIYVTDQVTVRPCIDTLFEDMLSKAPFQSDPQSARLTINNWVEQQTHNMFKDFLPPGSIIRSSTLVLVNAAYFKGMWKNKFNPEETRRNVFYVNPSKQFVVDMMHVKGTFNHDVSESLQAHILEMPYKGDQISMYVFLPPFTSDDAVENTLKKLTVDTFQSIVNSSRLTPKQVDISFPKFSLEQTIEELVPILKSFGAGNLFKGDEDFSKLSNSKDVITVHKAKIVVNEQGATAAAAGDETAIAFNCNRPFIFIIFSKSTRTILGTGVYRRPV